MPHFCHNSSGGGAVDNFVAMVKANNVLKFDAEKTQK